MNNKVKRFLSLFIDAVLFIFIAYLVNLLSTNLIVNNVSNYLDLITINNQILLDSGLYEQDGDEIVLISSEYDVKLTAYYEDETHIYYDKDNKATSYEDAKIQSGLFDETTLKVKSNVSDDDLESFYKDELENARVSIANITEYATNYKKISKIETINAYSCIIFTSFMYVFIIPLCNKDKATIGNKILKLKLCSSTGEKVTWIQLFMRFVAFFAVELITSLTFIGIPFIISIILMIFTKNNKLIHDFLAYTYIQDKTLEGTKDEKTD